MIKKFLVTTFGLILAAQIMSPVLVIPVSAATNLIANPSLETSSKTVPTGWAKDSWGTNKPTFTYAANGQNGTHSALVSMASYTSGDAKWAFTPVSVTGGHTYTFSDYYKATVPTYLVAETQDANGNLNYFQIGNALALSTAWKQVTGSFTLDSTVTKITVYHLINQNGTLQTDNFSLTDTTPINTSGIPNNSFETVSSTNSSLPASWTTGNWGTNTSSFTYVTNDGHTGTHSGKVDVTAYTSGDAKWVYPAQTASANAQYTFSDYYKANVITSVVVEVTLTDGTQTYIGLNDAPVASTWTKYSGNFTTPANTKTVTVFHLLNKVGSLQTDDYTFGSYVPVGFTRPLVTLTFDDGFATQATVAEPLLKTYSFPATFYITTGFLNDTDSYYMTNQNVIDLRNTGNQIADHTETHPHLPTLSSSQVITELSGSQSILQTTFGVAANDFASPFGDVNDAVMTQVKTYFRSHRGVLPGYNSKDNFNIYDIKVQNVEVMTTTAQVAAWITQAIQTKTWLVLVYHQVDHGGDQYSVTPENFANQLGALKTSGAPVVTLDAALNEILPQLGK